MADFVRFTTAAGEDPVEVWARFVGHILPSREAMIRSGEKQIGRIKTRTAQGRDVNGVPFQSYSAQYAKTRTKRGLASSPVDLRVTGRMLESMRAEVMSAHELAIAITDSGADGYAGSVNRRREFFAVSDQELGEVATDLMSNVNG